MHITVHKTTDKIGMVMNINVQFVISSTIFIQNLMILNKKF